MAVKIQKSLVDDLDGTKAEKTVSFRMDDGKKYRLDLSKKNYTALQKDLEPWIGAVTRNGNGSAGKGQLNVVREWAREQGYEVSDRGRVPGEIMEAFEEAHPEG